MGTNEEIKLTEKQLAEFRQLYHKHFGIWLSEEDTLEKATKLINFVAIVYKGKI